MDLRREWSLGGKTVGSAGHPRCLPSLGLLLLQAELHTKQAPLRGMWGAGRGEEVSGPSFRKFSPLTINFGMLSKENSIAIFTWS